MSRRSGNGVRTFFAEFETQAQALKFVQQFLGRQGRLDDDLLYLCSHFRTSEKGQGACTATLEFSPLSRKADEGRFADFRQMLSNAKTRELSNHP